MDARTHGSTLDLTFTNTGDKAIDLERRFPGPVPMYDALTVEVGGRSLSLTLPRRATPPPEVARLPAGGSFTESIDLQPWAVRAGGPLPAGTHAVTARWDATHASAGEHFVATAKTTVVIPEAVTLGPPRTASCVASTGGDVALLARQSGRTTVDVGVHNGGTATICIQRPPNLCVYSDDTLTFTLDGKRTLETVAAVCYWSANAQVVQLAPGASVWTTYDLAQLAGGTLARGTYDVAIAFEAPARPTRWHGKLNTQLYVAIP